MSKQLIGEVLVSCIMPTYNRRAFVPSAINYFLQQNHPNRELIIVDDGSDTIEDLVPEDDRIRYLRVEKQLVLGDKRNLACQEAKGDFIAHWDDDDWSANWRLSYQVTSLLMKQADVCGLNEVLYYDPASNQAWQYVYPKRRKPWVSGGTLCYTKTLWMRNPFPDARVGSDIRFLWSDVAKSILPLQDITFYIGLIHAANTSLKRPQYPLWQHLPIEEIQRLMGRDWSFYTDLFQDNEMRSRGVGRINHVSQFNNRRPDRPMQC